MTISPRPPAGPTRPFDTCRAVRDGSVRARSQAAWIRAVEAHLAFASFRSDAHRNLMAVAWVLARFADWHALTSRPTWQRLMDTSGMSRSSVAKYLRLLRDAGLLGIVESGTTPQFRSFLHADDGNRASVYVLCVPAHALVSPVEETRTPSRSPQESVATPPLAREEPGEHLAPTREVQHGVPVLSAISDRHLRSVLRPQWEAGWSVSDVLWCLDHKPSGELWPHTDAIRHVPGWIRYRLAAWAERRSPSQDRAEHRRALVAEQAQRAAELASIHAAAASPEAARAHAARARELLRHSPAAARIIDRRAVG